ncbi:pyridoxamine 5'-phosphate oxidase [Sphingobacterium sp. Lzh-3]|uniref:pyridoxamine 5'-phosphate oxidase n=1 Tax=unclassified Sphingobacterium TaxID=2609468 RepID=UPI002953C5A8|nr:pyridoxamine 5'-phosphate oxidase [Sphingobacterium sp. UGAL515B_05]WON93920.1 pyridoxamine 5'-phosphate oxidase [Sphingobacterium sp. UGAL515B_05]
MSIQHKDIAAIRQDYVLGSLSESDVDHDPIEQFKNWFDAAVHSEVNEPNAMVLSTVSSHHLPSSRIVLLKDIAEEGLVFFTNYLSRKGEEMKANPHAALLFFWPELQRQVRIEGVVEFVNAADSDEYFQSRPKASRIGALASPQSHEIPNRSFLERRVEALERQYEGDEFVPRPDHWGGYILKPIYFEFWQGRASRLHDRMVYKKVSDSWKITRIAP